MKKVLIYDCVYGHGECLTSYIYYFQKLGYTVDVCARESVLNENPLSLIDTKEINIFSMTDKVDGFQELSRLVDLSEYDIIFFATFNREEYMISVKVANKFPDIIILYQEHSHIQHFLKEAGNDDRIIKNAFCLGDIEELPQVSPVYFGKVKKLVKKENSLSLIISGLDKIHEEAYKRFVKAIDELVKDGYNISVKVCGIRGDWNYTKSKNIEVLGRIPFNELYDLYQNTDFLVVLFDQYAKTDKETQIEFMSGRTSGSRQGSIGFQIPLIIQKGYLKSWGLSNTNSISFDRNNIKSAIVKAYNLSNEDYSKMNKSLFALQKKYIDKSVKNISDKLKEISENPSKYKILKPVVKRIIRINPDGTRTIIR